MKQYETAPVHDGCSADLYREDGDFPEPETEIEAYLKAEEMLQQMKPCITLAVHGNGPYSLYESDGFCFEQELEPEELEKSFEDFLNEAFEEVMRKEEETPEVEKRSEEERESFLAKYRDKIPPAVLECVDTEEESD